MALTTKWVDCRQRFARLKGLSDFRRRSAGKSRRGPIGELGGDAHGGAGPDGCPSDPSKFQKCLTKPRRVKAAWSMLRT